MRKDKNLLSVEDVKKDFVKLQDQANYLEEKIVSLQKMTEANGIESKNKGDEPTASRPGDPVSLIWVNFQSGRYQEMLSSCQRR